MKPTTHQGGLMSAVRLGVSRQIAIPKKLHDELGLKPGDFLEVERQGSHLILTPKMLVTKEVEARLAQSLGDFKAGRSYGPFSSAEEAVASLHANVKKRRARKPRRSRS
jgi:AbrB family looped-hinge helix DNA binding protein